MPSYSRSSLAKLATCERDLEIVFTEVIKHFDNKILCGERGKAEQNYAFDMGHSKVQWPNGKHNVTDEDKAAGKKSRAVDAAPYPIDWKDRERMTLFAGFVLGIAASKGIKLRWGGDWDSDTEVADNGFDDLVHFELMD